MNKTKYILIAAFMGTILMGCKKGYLDINTNPNSATESVITPDLHITAQMTSTAARNASSWDFLARWLGYWSASGSYSRSTVEMSYNITNSTGAGIWEGTYYTVGQYRIIEKKSKDLGWTFYQGMAKILGSYEMMNLVDIYDNLPYSTAFDLSGNIRPKYDKSEDVYKALFAQVDSGLALIKAADVAASNPKIATRDIMFAGDKTKWAKFANTIKLKMLIHCTGTSTFNPATEIAKINSEGSGFLGNGVSAEIQPGYTTDKPNPFYSAHMFNAQNGNENDNYNRANQFTLNLMNSLNDPRVTYVYRKSKAGGIYRGTIYGSDPTATYQSDSTSGVGYGIGKSYSMPMWVMTSVEASFLVAEATIRGWITGNAQNAYTAAVKESFSWLGVTGASAAADTYLSSPSDKVAFPASGLTQQLSALAWQKYFALNGIGILETWNDVRRLKVVSPALSIAPERGSNPIPVRLLYPTSEYNYNSANVTAQGTISQFTNKVFWHK